MPLKVEHKIKAETDEIYVVWRKDTFPHIGYSPFREEWNPGERAVCVYVSDEYEAEDALSVATKHIMKDYVSQYEDAHDTSKRAFALMLSRLVSFTEAEKVQWFGYIFQQHNIKPNKTFKRKIRTSYWEN